MTFVCKIYLIFLVKKSRAGKYILALVQNSDHFKSPSRVRNFTSPDFSQIEEVHIFEMVENELTIFRNHASYFVTEFLFFSQSLAHPLIFI